MQRVPKKLGRTNLLPDNGRVLSLVLFASLSLATTGAMAKEPEDKVEATEPVAPLHSYVTSDDYPADAANKGEQGAVAFLLTIGVDGQPTDCVVTNSSGSSSLDSASCRIMMERARFRPARNAAGKPAIGNYESRIVWRLENPEPLPPGVETATSLWSACSWGEAAKLVTSELSAAEIATRASNACAPLEERIAIEIRKAGVKRLDSAKLIPDIKKDMAEKLAEMLDRARAALKGEVRK